MSYIKLGHSFMNTYHKSEIDLCYGILCDLSSSPFQMSILIKHKALTQRLCLSWKFLAGPVPRIAMRLI